MKAIAVNLRKIPFKKMTVTLKLTGIREFRFRIWLATILFRVGAKVMPLKTDVKVDRQ